MIRVLPICAMLCVVVPTFAGRQPASDEAWQKFGFAACELPCVAGITPGQTSFNVVPNLLMRHIPVIDPLMLNSGASINFWARIPSQQLGGLIQYERGLVGEMRFNVILPLAQMVESLGTPDCILPNNSSQADQVSVIFWEREGVSIGAVLPADEPVVDLSSQTLALWVRNVQPEDCALRGAVAWRGFAPIWDYAR